MLGLQREWPGAWVFLGTLTAVLRKNRIARFIRPQPPAWSRSFRVPQRMVLLLCSRVPERSLRFEQTSNVSDNILLPTSDAEGLAYDIIGEDNIGGTISGNLEDEKTCLLEHREVERQDGGRALMNVALFLLR